jgi:hypothetical protein
MNAKQICGAIVALCVAVVAARADSLELKNLSLIKGKFMGGTETSISFQVGSSVQSYDVADIRSLRFGVRSAGCLALGSLEAAECSFALRKREQ